MDELIKKEIKVIVVNDGSKKETLHIFKKLNKNITLLVHKVNQGKGQALKTGFKYIYENFKCKGVTVADADGQHSIKDILKVCETLNQTQNCLVLGSRLGSKKTPLRSKFGNALTRFVFKLATGTRVFDTQSGLRGIPFEFLERFLNIEGQRYEYEINMLLYCAKEKITIKEIPIETIYIDNNKSSSFNVISDSIKIYSCILKNSNISTSILYTLSAILSFIIDFVLLLILNKITNNITNKDLALFISVVIARIFSSLFNFLFNRNIVFKSNVSYINSFIKYYSLVIGALIVNYLLLDILAVRLSINLVIAKIVVEFTIFILNYFIQKVFIFKRSK